MAVEEHRALCAANNIEPLADLSKGRPQRMALVAGIVTYTREPSKTRGTDYSSSFTITDPSLPQTVEGFVINVFRTSVDQMPQVSVGDAVSCSVKVVHLI